MTCGDQDYSGFSERSQLSRIVLSGMPVDLIQQVIYHIHPGPFLLWQSSDYSHGCYGITNMEIIIWTLWLHLRNRLSDE